MTTERVNGGTPITFTYDPDRLVTGVGALTLTRNPQNGLLTGSTLGNVTDTYTYSTFGEVSGYQATYSGTPQLATQYTRDTLGRIIQKTETLAGVTDTYAYTYDTVGRLTDVTKNGVAAAHYEYDANGNRLSVTRPGIGTVSGTYDAQDRLTAYGAVSYTYTANGDLQTATSGGQTTTYSYDVSGNLLAVTLPTGTQIAYVIDGQNRRIGKKVNGTLVQGFLYSGRLRPVAEVDGTGQIVSRFVYGTKVNVPDYFVKAGVTYRIITDHLGSPRLVINASTGVVVQRLAYDEFGQITQDTNPGFQPFGFAGGLYDPDTKLTRFGARDYDAFTGRWTAKDPIGFGGGDPSLYGYVSNNPLNLTDPTGLQRLITPLDTLGELAKAHFLVKRLVEGTVTAAEQVVDMAQNDPAELMHRTGKLLHWAGEMAASGVMTGWAILNAGMESTFKAGMEMLNLSPRASDAAEGTPSTPAQPDGGAIPTESRSEAGPPCVDCGTDTGAPDWS